MTGKGDWYGTHSLSPETTGRDEYLDWAYDHGASAEELEDAHYSWDED